MPPEPRLAADAHIFFLDDDGLVFSEARQELHVLNTSAAVIWCLLADGLEREAMVADLCDRLGLTRAEAAGYVTDALADWSAKGLLAGSHGPERPATPAGWRPQAGLPCYPNVVPGFMATRCYRLLTTSFRLRFLSRAQFALLHPLMIHLEAPDDPAALCFDVLEREGLAILYRDGEPLQACGTHEHLAPMVYACVWMTALRAYPFWLNIHAGVVRGRQGCVLMPAAPGCGKSTLTLGLVQGGFEYYSDEVALLDPDTLQVVPFPQAICVKESGIPAAAALFPEAAALPLHLRGDGKRVAYVAPPRSRLPPPGTKGDVRVVLFPRYQPGAAARCEPLAPAVALGRLLDQCTAIEGRLNVTAVGRLVDWITRLDCHELTYGTTADAVTTVAGLLSAKV